MNDSELSRLCADKGVTVESEFEGFEVERFHWKATLMFDGRSVILDFFTGVADSHDPPSRFQFPGCDGAPAPRDWRYSNTIYSTRLRAAWFSDPRCPIKPDVADVVNCLCNDARAGQLSFEEFCSEFGYDSDSRRAHKTWRTCRSNALKALVLFGADFETFARAEH